jgi:hypothetical protein
LYNDFLFEKNPSPSLAYCLELFNFEGRNSLIIIKVIKQLPGTLLIYDPKHPKHPKSKTY